MERENGSSVSLKVIPSNGEKRNEAEEKVKEEYEKEGFNVWKTSRESLPDEVIEYADFDNMLSEKGCPDLIAYEGEVNDNPKFIEVKSSSGGLRMGQVKWIATYCDSYNVDVVYLDEEEEYDEKEFESNVNRMKDNVANLKKREEKLRKEIDELKSTVREVEGNKREIEKRLWNFIGKDPKGIKSRLEDIIEFIDQNID